MQLTVREYSEMVGLTPNSVYRRIYRGQLRAIQKGKRWVILIPTDEQPPTKKAAYEALAHLVKVEIFLRDVIVGRQSAEQKLKEVEQC